VSDVALAFRQIRFENRSFWRNPPAALFTFAFPLMFLAIFNLLFGNNRLEVPGGTVNSSTFYVPAIVALSVVGACYTNIAISVSFARDQGLLKRVRGTPLPAWAFLFGRIVHATLVALLLVIIVTVAGRVAYGVEIPTNTMPAFLITLIVGAATFSSLGLAVTSVIPNAEASPAIVNASILPLMFISDIFIPLDNVPVPGWVKTFGDIFPVKHFSEALQIAFNPFERGAGFDLGHLAVMGAWGLAALLLAIRFFSWEPRR
jgi:ABC-2 type transport system permease protein